MIKVFVLISTFLVPNLLGNCQSSKSTVIFKKNECYFQKLANVRETSLYKMVHSQFADTFLVLKKDKRYFGVPFVENKIDEAIFFNKDSSECILIVLQRNEDKLVFGSARMIRGQSINETTWKFAPSMHYSFAKDYFQLYKGNTFENISQLARYSVLTEGNVKRNGCDIDEYYWFVHMK